MGLPEAIRSTGCRVAVLCGGSSSERAVSLVSGKAVADALEAAGVPCDLFELEENRLPENLSPSIHLVLPVIHGTYGEDGRLSAELESRGFAYAGCAQASSVLCFDKLACKAMADRLGLPVAKDLLLSPTSPIEYGEVASELGDTFILKPRRDGSSVGLHLIHQEEDYHGAREDLASSEYIAETFIDGYDLTVGVLNDEALGVVAVYPKSGLYDYDHKYTSGMSRYEAPADLPEVLAARLRQWSLVIFRACGCRDLARVDFRLGEDGKAVFLEVNTLPGMTPTSLLPKSAGCLGLTFSELVLSWTSFAMRRMEGCNG
ncbi:MAG: D-alanine--D-alanine ligase [Puniceicoccaceae bacterium]